MPRRKVWYFLALALWIGGPSACEEGVSVPAQGPRLTPPPKPRAARPVKTIYRQHCASCHGDLGGGDGMAANLLVRPPRNWTLPGALEGWTDARLAERIEKGIPGEGKRPAPMPAFEGVFTPEEIKGLAAYVRELAGSPPGRE